MRIIKIDENSLKIFWHKIINEKKKENKEIY